MGRDPGPFFADPLESLQWGHEGISEIDSLARTFFKSAHHEFVTEQDPDTGENVDKFRLLDPIPRTISRKTKETLGHLRDSLDQSIFAARQFLSAPHRNKTVHFPVATDPDDLNTRLRNPDIPIILHSAIREFEPYYRGQGYPGGNDAIRQLLQIAGKGKHTVNLTATLAPLFGLLPDFRFESALGDVHIRVPRWDPVKQEIELARYPANLKSQGNTSLAIAVAFNEAGALSGEPVVDILRALFKKADCFVKAAERECGQHC